MSKKISFLFLFISSIALFAQDNNVYIPKHLRTDTLLINASNPKILFYRGEKIFVFENYVDSNKVIIAPEELPNGKYMAFYMNDTTKPEIEISYYQRKKNGSEKRYERGMRLESTKNYKNGKLNEELYYGKDGKVYEQTLCKEGKHCTTTRYENDGSIVKTYEKRKKSIIKKWDSTGKLIQKEILKNGKCIMLKSYDTYNKCWEKRKL